MPDPAGTCHASGCPGKGTFDEHVRRPIGAGTWADYTAPNSPGPWLRLHVDDVTHLLDHHELRGPDCDRTSDEALFHRLSEALAQHRNGGQR